MADVRTVLDGRRKEIQRLRERIAELEDLGRVGRLLSRTPPCELPRNQTREAEAFRPGAVSAEAPWAVHGVRLAPDSRPEEAGQEGTREEWVAGGDPNGGEDGDGLGAALRSAEGDPDGGRTFAGHAVSAREARVTKANRELRPRQFSPLNRLLKLPKLELLSL